MTERESTGYRCISVYRGLKTSEERKREREKREGEGEERKVEAVRPFFHDEKTVSPIVDRYPSWNNRDNEKATQPKSFAFSLLFSVTNSPRLLPYFSFRPSYFAGLLLVASAEPMAFLLSSSFAVVFIVAQTHGSLAIALAKNRKEPQLSPSIKFTFFSLSFFFLSFEGKIKKHPARRDE